MSIRSVGRAVLLGGAWVLAVSAGRAQGVNAGDTLRLAASIERVRVLGGDGVRLAVLGKTIAVDLDDVSVPDAVEAIAREVGLAVTYRDRAVPLARRVSLRAANITVTDALLVTLRGTGLDAVVSTTGMLLLVRHGAPIPAASQQAGSISGRVTDAATRSPLDQVSVRLEGPGLGGVTGADGRYMIHGAASGIYRIVARRVGYVPLTTTITVTADSTTTADFALAAAATKLNEVVTTAVGDQRRYEVGNVISTINADSIAPTAPITSLTDLISARAPGVTVEEASGLTGAGETIRIRGQSSLVLQGDPIIIVDGVRQNNAAGGTAKALLFSSGYTAALAVPSPSRLNDLDFRDIQSIDVLKGPAASTEYGTDAANGVLVVTTKRGSAGRPQWQASAEETGSQLPESFPNLYYSWGHTTDSSHASVACPLVAYAYGPGRGSTDGSCAIDSVTAWNPLNHPYYSIFGTGSRQKYDLSVSGGSTTTRYFVSGGVSHEIGILRMPGAFASEATALGLPHSVFQPSGEDQRSVRGNTAITLGPSADLLITGAYLSTFQKSPTATVILSGLTEVPALPDSSTAYGYGFWYDSPIAQFALPNSEVTGRTTGGLSASLHPRAWLVAHGTVGVDHGSQQYTTGVLPQIAPIYPYIPAQLGVQNATTDVYTADARASATIAVMPTVRAVTSVGLQLADTRTQGTKATAIGITATNVTLNGAVNPNVAQLGNRQATLGGYGEEQLGLSDRLFLTGALRIDAGSGFGRAYSSAVYPKASISWLALNGQDRTVRLRAAFGESGVQPPNGSALQLLTPAIVWLNGGPTSGVAIGNVQNQLLRPERSEEYEGGVDLNLWQNQLTIELTGYSKTTQDALVSTGTGWDAGGLSYVENVGEVRNTGLEAAVTATLVRGQALTWDVSLNMSINHNKLVALAPGILSQQFRPSLAAYQFAPGFPLYGYWAPKVQYADLNHDHVIEPNEVTVGNTLSYAGAALPAREASFGTRVGMWNGAVSLSALVDLRAGYRLANSTAWAAAVGPQNDWASNGRAAPLWEQARDVAAQVIEVKGLDNYLPPAGFYEDASYVRFRELALTYAVPRGIVRAMRVQSMSITGAVRNLALWTRYTGADPEVTSLVGAQLSPTSNTSVVNHDLREDVGAIPLPRYWVLRLNLGL